MERELVRRPFELKRKNISRDLEAIQISNKRSDFPGLAGKINEYIKNRDSRGLIETLIELIGLLLRNKLIDANYKTLAGTDIQEVIYWCSRYRIISEETFLDLNSLLKLRECSRGEVSEADHKHKITYLDINPYRKQLTYVKNSQGSQIDKEDSYHFSQSLKILYSFLLDLAKRDGKQEEFQPFLQELLSTIKKLK